MTSMRDAERMGREAFEAGKPGAPALNHKFLEKHVAGKPIGSDSSKLMKAYLLGWDKANLAAPVPGINA